MTQKKDEFRAYIDVVMQNAARELTLRITARKIVRLVVVVVCLVGFVYQASTYMQLYWQYRTVVDVKVTNPSRVDIPSITICNNNGLRITSLCRKYPENCTRILKEDEPQFCERHDRYCIDGRLNRSNIFPENDFLLRISYWDQKEKEPYLQKRKNFVESCQIQRIDETSSDTCNYSNLIQRRCQSGTDTTNVCFTLYSQIGKANGKQPQLLAQQEYFVAIFDLDPYEYDPRITQVKAQVAVHHPWSIVNPYEEGIPLIVGKYYNMRLKKTVRNLLTPPYDTNCIDYMTDWKARNGNGPTTERECIYECQLNASIQVHGCVNKNFILPTNVRLCGKDEKIKPEVAYIAQTCIDEKCKPACYQEYYEITSEDEVMDGINPCNDREDRTEEHHRRMTTNVGMQIKFNTMDTVTYTYQPQFELIETFSYLGGYVGMWLGISLLAIYDVVETFLAVILQPKKEEKQKKKSEDVKNTGTI